jgi:hypothetical protein
MESVGGNGVLLFATGNTNFFFLLKASNLACQPYLRIFPLRLPLGQFSPKIPLDSKIIYFYYLSYFPYRGQTGSRSMQEQQKELRI